MRKSTYLAVAALLVIVLPPAIFSLGLGPYGQAVVGGFLVNESLPLSWGLKRHFRANREDFEAIARRFRIDPEIEAIIASPLSATGLCVNRNSGKLCSEFDDEPLKASLEVANTSHVWRKGTVVEFYIADSCFGRKQFYIWIEKTKPEVTNAESCDEADSEQPFGSCKFVLYSEWTLEYKWFLREDC